MGGRSPALHRIRRIFLQCGRNQSAPASAPDRPGRLTDPEVDYFALANYLIDMHGTGARAEAARLMEDAAREDDLLAATDWLTVRHAIELLTNDFAGARH
jgi:hypothetical protein